jgi:hypothetical protein
MQTIPIPGAEIYYDKNFLSPEEATALFNLLRFVLGQLICQRPPRNGVQNRRLGGVPHTQWYSAPARS